MMLIGRIGLVAASRCGTLLLAIAFPLLNLGRSPAYAITARVCITAAEILLTPAWTLAVMDRSADRDRGRNLGIFTAAWLGHSLYGPASGTWIYGMFGGRNLCGHARRSASSSGRCIAARWASCHLPVRDDDGSTTIFVSVPIGKPPRIRSWGARGSAAITVNGQA